MPDRKIRYIVFLALLVAASCSKQKSAPTSEFIPELGVERAENVAIIYSDSAEIRVKVTGPTMLNHTDRREPYQEFPDGLEVFFYGEDLELTSTLAAGYGIRYDNRDQVIVRDSVVWKSMNEQRLETEELTWNERTQKVYTNHFAAIITPEDTIFTRYFEANQNFKNIKFRSNSGSKGIQSLSKEVE
jgi:LPS export ABC transporter protein LptC